MPAGDSLRTPWIPSRPVPLPEYPRPQMRRLEWINLNGMWEYAILPRESQAPAQFDGEILVPYAVESALSGVQKPLFPHQRLWYRRYFNIWDSWLQQRVLLHFGAVDYRCDVWINDLHVGSHQGGYLPFSLDVTRALKQKDNEIIVSVWDPTDSGLQQRGKQVLQPKGIWYTAVSGIWQTVWLEPVPAASIESLRLTPGLEQKSLKIEAVIHGNPHGLQLEAEIISSGRKLTFTSGQPGKPLELGVPDAHLWSPEDPFLYDLNVRLTRGAAPVDEVTSYFAMRSFGLLRDSAGHMRFALNGKPLFLYGPLDQGYFPDGLYTPPSEEAMLYDIQYAKDLGCNLIRKHVKVEPLRWYYTCDRLGMIVWQDMPNGGRIDGETVAILSLLFGFHRNDRHWLGRFGRAEESNRQEYRAELQGLIDLLYNSPCIAAWVPFNESWGQFHSKQIANWAKDYDPTRLVDHASGWFDQGAGDFQSKHVYFKKLFPPRRDRRAFVVSEFGGYSLKVQDHMWDPDKKFGYRFYDSSEALTGAYVALLRDELLPLIPQGLAAAVYTQTADVEIEINGYLTYDRQVEKMDSARLRQAHAELFRHPFSRLGSKAE